MLQHEHLEAVLACDPSLTGCEIVVMGGGENNTVLAVGGEYVFRFPRNQTALRRLRAEATLLSRIGRSSPVPLPAPTHVRVDAPLGSAFMGYRILPGAPFSAETWLGLNPAGRERVAATLGGFLAWLHGLPFGVAAGIELPRTDEKEHWRRLSERFEQILFPHMSQVGREKVAEEYRQYTMGAGAGRIPSCLIHGDFGPSNILYDTGRGTVAGIIDFGSCRWGDPAVDIAALIGPMGYRGIGELIAREYAGVPGLMPRARYYASTFALQEALYALEQRDEELFGQCMIGYR